MTHDSTPCLKDLRFSAKIDFISIDGLRKTALPRLDGTFRWPNKHRGMRLTVHDPSAADIALLGRLLPHGRLAEAEVAVDVRARRSLNDAAFIDTLTKVKSEYLAKGLWPKFGPGLNSGFRGTFKKTATGFSLAPFNRRVPGVCEQLLYGKRDDGAQVKVYLKGRDQNRSLPVSENCVRVEVRLGHLGLSAHGLTHITDLADFRFRRELMPYFQHVQGTKNRVTKARNSTSAIRQVLLTKLQQIDNKYWKTVGVGAFERGGRREDSGMRFARDTVMNQRIGQALLRLQRGHQSEKFVRSKPSGNS